jgi:hypothetical protein
MASGVRTGKARSSDRVSVQGLRTAQEQDWKRFPWLDDLATSYRSGESRDIVFALLRFDELLHYYCEEARESGGGKCFNDQLHARTPAEYDPGSRVVNSKWRFLLNIAVMGMLSPGGSVGFGDEFGLAIALSAARGGRSPARSDCRDRHVCPPDTGTGLRRMVHPIRGRAGQLRGATIWASIVPSFLDQGPWTIHSFGLKPCVWQ